MRTVKVVGAGFSGLVTAYFLVKKGFTVRVVEKTSRVGGLIRTIRTPHGLVETAANGILGSARLEAMCADIGVPLQTTRREGRKRFIYRNKPRQMPLDLSDIAKLLVRFGLNLNALNPRPFETISNWGARVLGKGATDYLLAPALGGIYAGDPNEMSASLIFGRAQLPGHLNTYRPVKGKVRGTVAPAGGMQRLIEGLCDYLTKAGVEFVFNHDERSPADEPTIICLSARAASDYLTNSAPELSAALARIEMLSLVTSTCFFAADAATLKGFGCLFPRDQGFRARGVLFNDCIFEGRGHGETWIFGGALDAKVVNLDDNELKNLIAAERDHLYGENDQPIECHITRWPMTLPHYSIELERVLTTLPALPPNMQLVGNYLGRIGLAKILERAAYVVDHFSETP